MPYQLSTQTASQHNIFDSEKLSQICLVLLTQTRVRTLGLWISSPTLYQLSHQITPDFENRTHSWLFKSPGDFRTIGTVLRNSKNPQALFQPCFLSTRSQPSLSLVLPSKKTLSIHIYIYINQLVYSKSKPQILADTTQWVWYWQLRRNRLKNQSHDAITKDQDNVRKQTMADSMLHNHTPPPPPPPNTKNPQPKTTNPNKQKTPSKTCTDNLKNLIAHPSQWDHCAI